MTLLLLALARLALQMIGAYVTALVALDEWWWSSRRYWRYLTAGILALLIVGLLQWPIS